MPTPSQCPKCGATDDIDNIEDLYGLFGEANETENEWLCNSCGHMFNDDESVPWFAGQDFSKMSISQIADVIFSDWHNIDSHTVQYLEAMMSLENIDDNYGDDSATSIISYFLAGAQKWRGETAKKVKAHLNKLVADQHKSEKHSNKKINTLFDI